MKLRFVRKTPNVVDLAFARTEIHVLQQWWEEMVEIDPNEGLQAVGEWRDIEVYRDDEALKKEMK